MSSISGIGGAMGISVGAGMSLGGASAATGTTGLDASASSIAPSTQSLGAGLPESLQSLAQTMKDFSSAEILIALMLSGGGRSKDDDEQGGGGGAAGAFLAGMAMAGMMGQQSHLNLQFNMPLAGSGQVSGAGLSLNVSI